MTKLVFGREQLVKALSPRVNAVPFMYSVRLSGCVRTDDAALALVVGLDECLLLGVNNLAEPKPVAVRIFVAGLHQAPIANLQ